MRTLRILLVFVLAALVSSGLAPAKAAEGDVLIYLIRHGQSVDNLNGLQSGWSSTPLTPLGVRQSTMIGTKLVNVQFTAAISSGSVRAVQTLEAVLKTRETPLTPVKDTHFREWGVGSFDQKPVGLVQETMAKKLKTSVANLWKYTDETKFNALAASDPSKKAETWAKFKSRIVGGMRLVLEKNRGGKVALVTHGYVIKHLVKQLTGKWATGSISNTSVTVLVYRSGKWTLQQGPTLNPTIAQ